MSDSFKMPDEVPGRAGDPTVGSSGREDPGAICYRMEAERRLLSSPGCGAECRHHGQNAGNHSPPCLLSDQRHTTVDLERVRRVAMMVTPQGEGDVVDQVWEAVSTIRAILKQQQVPMTVTLQTIFLRSPEDEVICRRLFEAYYGERMPATNFVLQPPCGGQAVAIEAWALGGKQATVDFHLPGVVSVAYEGLRWIHVGGISPPETVRGAYPQARHAFAEMARRLELAGSSFQDVVRTWLYQGGITEIEQDVERYRELNRARSDFFSEQEANGRMRVCRDGGVFYPASTGIGTLGRGLTMGCLGLQTQRTDVQLRPLENPWQTSAFQYAQRFSAKSPKFSRAMAVQIGDYVTTWVSGTASILNSESVHLGDIEKQTEQTIDNIERLISAENLERHGMSGAGSRLSDLAKVRVYVKRLEDFELCRAICDRRLGRLPTVYAHADVCRPELLVEIEGVAFARSHSVTGGGDSSLTNLSPGDG